MQKHDTLIIACAGPDNRSQLRFALQEKYNLLETINLPQTLQLLEQNTDCVAAVVLATSAIHPHDPQILDDAGATDLLQTVPVIIITEDSSHSDPRPFFRSGAADVIPIDYDSYAMLHRIEVITQLHLYKQHLEAVVQEQADTLRRTNETIVDVLSSIIEYRSVETGYHILRIRYLTKILAEEVMRTCPEYQLTDHLVSIISSASALHDIGKIAVPDSILLKPGPLNDQEWEIMKTHALTGCRILEGLGSTADQEYLRYAHNICHYHHERWGGEGYPEGISGEDIPICAQIVGLTDAFEALTSKRVYKDSYACRQAVNMILNGECGTFSPKLLECFKNVSLQFASITKEYADQQLTGGEDEPDLTLPTLEIEPESGSSGLELLQAKYFALVHQLGGFLVEVNLDRNLFHVVYNPYPELTSMDGVKTLEDLYTTLADRVAVPEERDHVRWLVREWVQEFVDEGLRRSTHHFHHQATETEPGGLMEMTFLRISSTIRRSLAILLRKRPQDEVDALSGPGWQQSPEETDIICRNDQNLTLVRLLREDQIFWGYAPQELWDRFDGHLIEMVHPDDRKRLLSEIRQQLRDGVRVKADHRMLLKDGSVRWVTAKCRLVVGEDGYEYLHCVMTDITAARTALQELEEHYGRFQMVLKQAQTVLFIWDRGSDTLTVSASWDSLFPYDPPASGIAQYLAQASRIHPDDTPLLLDKLSALESGAERESLEVRIAIEGGRYRWCRFHSHTVRGDKGKLLQIIGTITNVDEEKRAAEVLEAKAERDSLTKLLNKEAGRKQIEEYLSHYPQGASCALLIIDLDKFKEINDTYGHLFGDAVLTKVSQEITRQFRSQDILCRIGGDEFLVLVRGLSDREILASRCRQFIDSLGMDLRGQDKRLELSCSIGIALSPDHGTTYYELFNHADQALYQVKNEGRNGFRFYEPQADAVFGRQTIQATAVSGKIDSDEEPGLAGGSLIHQILHRLYSATDVDAAIHEVFAMLGAKTNVSRVYVFENSEDNSYCSNTFEWCNEGIAPEIQNLQHISYETDIPHYEDNFNEQGVFYVSDIRTQPKNIYDILEPQGVKSILHCAIRQDGVFRGYIGFDECVEQRLWTKEEIDTLTDLCEILSLFLLRHREQEREARRAADMRAILDHQSAWLSIIDPETLEIQFLNRAIQEALPQAQVGQRCCESIMGRKDICPQCPIVGLGENDTHRVLLEDQAHHNQILAEATTIQWKGESRCLLTCRPLSK